MASDARWRKLFMLWENTLLATSVHKEIKEETAADNAFVLSTSMLQDGVDPTVFEREDDVLRKECLDKLEKNESAHRRFNTALDGYWKWKKASKCLVGLIHEIDHEYQVTLSHHGIEMLIRDIWSNPIALGHFCRPVEVTCDGISPAIDYTYLDRVYNAFAELDRRNDSVSGAVPPQLKYQRLIMSAIGKMCDTIQGFCSGYETPLLLRFILIFTRCPYFANLLEFRDLLEVYRCVKPLPEKAREILVSWLVHCPLAELEWQLDLVRLMLTVTTTADEIPPMHLADTLGPTVRHGLAFLRTVYDANKKRRESQMRNELTVAFYEKKLPMKDLAVNSLKPLELDFVCETEFHNDGINQNAAMVLHDFKMWHCGGNDSSSGFDLLDNSFVLDAASKALILNYYSTSQQIYESRRPNMSSLPYLIIQVRRLHLVEDALNQLTKAQTCEPSVPTSRLRKPLKVIFKGEEGVDEGGVAKEFFQLLVEQLFNPDYGMFKYEQTRYFWFRNESLEGLVQFELIGIVLGLALYNNIILDVHFPPVVYKKLLSGSAAATARPGHTTATRSDEASAFNSSSSETVSPGGISQRSTDQVAQQRPAENHPATESNHHSQSEDNSAARRSRAPATTRLIMEIMGFPPIFIDQFRGGMHRQETSDHDIVAEMANSLPLYEPCLEDLEDIEPQIVKSLRQLLMAPAETVASMCLTFSVGVEQFGETVIIPLKENIDEEVTADNREEYVKRLLQYYLVDSIGPQFKAFYTGFHRCCGGPLMRLFSASDLNLVICGRTGDLDFREWEKVAHYQDGYTTDSPTVRAFWEVVHEMNQEDRKKLLFFITGSDRTPVKGLSSLRLIIGKAGGDKTRVPTAHTCFNYLLRIALENRHGFGLR